MASPRVLPWQPVQPRQHGALEKAARAAARDMRVWFVIAAVLMTLAVGITLYGWLDDAGRVRHTQQTTLYTGTEAWLNGQERNCAAFPTGDGSILFLGCVKGTEDFSTPLAQDVKFWGRVKRPDMSLAMRTSPADNAWRWRCTRKDDDVTCWAVN